MQPGLVCTRPRIPACIMGESFPRSSLPFSDIRTLGSSTSKGEPQAVTANSSGTNGKQKLWGFLKIKLDSGNF